MAGARLLFVDDETDLLAFYRQVFEKDHEVSVFSGAREALAHLQTDPDYAVIVSDFSMPGMDGIEFLAEARTVAPRAVRIMLTGYASEETAINAVNRGDIYKFLRKPTRIAEFSQAINSALRQHAVLAAEHELLEQTLRGSIEMLTEVLSLANPLIFGRSTRRKDHMLQLARRMRLENTWELEAAAMLCEVGLLTQSENIIHKIVHHDAMTPLEEQESHRQARIGADLVRKVPRLEGVAESILYQYKHFDGSGYPEDETLAGTDIPVGARMLLALKDFRRALAQGHEHADVLDNMRRRGNLYDREIVEALGQLDTLDGESEVLRLSVFSLTAGAVLAADVFSRRGSLVMRKGQEVSPYLAEKLHHFADAGEIDRNVDIYALRNVDRESAQADQQKPETTSGEAVDG
jgi:response regulator RpfG family c-di-GMP phosphodiesterase